MRTLFQNFKFLGAILGAFLFVLSHHGEGHAAEKAVIYKNEFCGCCENWAEHLRKAGFEVIIINQDNVAPLKRQLGIPDYLWSCHTAKIGGYIVEGHVPVDDIKALLLEKPDVLGIAVPGMPIGSPGMEVPGQLPETYFSILFTAEGSSGLFARHTGAS